MNLMSEIIRVRVTSQDRERMERLANDAGVSLSSWARAELRHSVEQAKKRRRRIDPIQPTKFPAGFHVGMKVTCIKGDGTPIELTIVSVGTAGEGKPK
jgi:predicted nucleic acid-binding protein